MNQNIPNDLLWTAYQYAVGELPEPAAREFEERLSEEQAAREALAEAVAWHETVRAAEELAPTLVAQASTAGVTPATAASAIMPAAVQQNWRVAAGWVAVGAAACLALVFASQQIRTQPGAATAEHSAPHADADTHLLAALSFDGAANAPSPLVAPLHGDTAHGYSGNGDIAATEIGGLASDDAFEVPQGSELDVTAPDWLLAAVAESSEFGGNE